MLSFLKRSIGSLRNFKRDWRKQKRNRKQDKFLSAQAQFVTLLQNGDIELADVFIKNLGDELSALAPTLQERLNAERRALVKGLKSSVRVKLWWADRPFPGNIGDAFNPWLIEKITGNPVVRADPSDGVLLAAGSIAGRASGKSHVWGSGFLSRKNVIAPAARWHAVRGPLTRRMVLESGGCCPAIYGDPALIVPRFYPHSAKGGRIGIILHYSHRHLLKPGDAKVISTEGCDEAGIVAFIDAILECDYIFSSSLHGLIFANAYGIEARRCTFSGRRSSIGGDDMKFSDYWLGVGLAEHETFNLGLLKNFDEKILSTYKIHQKSIRFNGDALLEAFPALQRQNQN
jgi:hypothetical protein